MVEIWSTWDRFFFFPLLIKYNVVYWVLNEVCHLYFPKSPVIMVFYFYGYIILLGYIADIQNYRCIVQWFTILKVILHLQLLQNIGYIPCVIQYRLVAYFIHNSLYFLLPTLIHPLSPSLFLMVSTHFLGSLCL